jgi:hypothetical protein
MEIIKEGYSRVTDILGIWNTIFMENGEVIGKSFAGSRFKIDIDVLDNKANIGNNVHKAIEAHLDGFSVPLGEREQLYFDSFRAWYDKSGCEVVEKEERYYDDELMITGKIDALVKFPNNDELILLDFKTSAQESPKIWPLQATMYYYLLKKNGKTVSDRLLFLKLDRYGKKAKLFEYKFIPELFNVCLAACTCNHYIKS